MSLLFHIIPWQKYDMVYHYRMKFGLEKSSRLWFLTGVLSGIVVKIIWEHLEAFLYLDQKSLKFFVRWFVFFAMICHLKVLLLLTKLITIAVDLVNFLKSSDYFLRLYMYM